jgi:hypothetical protein
MVKSKKRRARNRKPVNPAERVSPPPEAAQHARPWPMLGLLERGPDGGGLTSQQFEAALLIVEGFRTITRGVGHKPIDLARVGIGTGDIGPRAARLWAVYVVWANEFQRRHLLPGHVVVDWVEDARPIYPATVALIAKAADLWDRMAGDYDRAQRVARVEVDA